MQQVFQEECKKEMRLQELTIMQKVSEAQSEIEKLKQEKEVLKVSEDKRRVDDKLKYMKQQEAKIQKLKDKSRQELSSMQIRHDKEI